MAAPSSSHFLSFFFLLIFIFILPAASDTSELVTEVCNRTANYGFCVSALYSDYRTPYADNYLLAYISFRVAYLNATRTRDHIAAELLKNSSSPEHLRRCQRDYEKAVEAIELAYNDLNAEDFYQLRNLAGEAGDAADDCNAAFNGIAPAPLSGMNRDMKDLSEICVSVSKLFSISM